MLRVCESFSETIRNMFGCGCYFVVECYGSVLCGCLIDSVWSSQAVQRCYFLLLFLSHPTLS